MKKFIFFSASLLFIFFSVSNSQQSSFDSSGVNSSLRKNIVTYGIIGLSASAIFVEYQWWWKGEAKAFEFRSTGLLDAHSRGVDKAGHFYTSYFIYTTINDLLRWAEVDEDKRFWLSVLIPSFHALTIEIADGFSRYYFDPNDLSANLLGVGYGFLQSKYSFLENFVFKFSYFPSGWISFDSKWELGGDYDGHIYWLSANVHNLLPEKASSYWPKFLNLSIGYGAKNISRNATGEIQRSFTIGLDYNLNEIPPFGETWNTVKHILDKFKLPAPGIRIYENLHTVEKGIILN